MTTSDNPAAEIAALRAILEGRTTPPTREEDLAHNGWWLVMVDDGRGDLMPWVSLRPSRAPTSTTRYTRFIPLRDGRPCAWPVAPEVPR